MDIIKDKECEKLIKQFYYLLDIATNANEFKPILTDDFTLGFQKAARTNNANHFKLKKSLYKDEKHILLSIDRIHSTARLATVSTTMEWKATQLAKENAPQQFLHANIHHTWLIERDKSGQLKLAGQLVDDFVYLKDSDIKQSHIEKFQT